MSNDPQPQKCLDYNLAREIQRDIEELPGAWSSSLVSLAEREPNAYRIELNVSGLSGEAAASFQVIAEAHGVWLSIAPDPDRSVATNLRVVFNRPGQWYAEGNQHRLEQS
jgi:hypothetical protein